jgi:hypothetical protein
VTAPTHETWCAKPSRGLITLGYGNAAPLATVTRWWHHEPMLSPEDETRAVTEVSQRLVESFPDVAPDVIQHTVHTSHEQFAGSPIRDFVPVLVERSAKSSLSARLVAH